jgi:diguanylate cyclase (GGDEF)-like protein/PAS domain S-box-containing protein
MQVLRSGHEVRDVVMGLHRPDGVLVWLLVNAVPFDVDGERTVVVSFEDITAMTTLRQALAASEQRFRLLADNVADVVVHTRDGQVAWASHALVRVLGWHPQEWAGAEITEYIHPDDVAAHRAVEAALTPDDTLVSRTRYRTVDGAYRTMESRTRPFVDERGALDGVLTSFHDVEAEVHAEEMHFRATHDDLTGLLTREEATRRLEPLVARAGRGTPVAVAFCDIDDFKSINDTHGHAAGDEVLTVLTQRMRDSVRRSDSLARLGGDEILAVCVDVSSLETARRIAETLRLSAAETISTSHGDVATSISVGITLVQPGDSVDDVIDRADRAMYAAKELGKNRVVALVD